MLITKSAAFTEKKLLSMIRQGDYAHAGEEEAIDLCMAKFSRLRERKILDIGCGLGKTATVIQEKGYGQVTGIDIDKNTIEYAKKYYPECNFYVANAQSLAGNVDPDFDMAILFNSYYSFVDQYAALSEIYKILNAKGSILIFDYTDLCEDRTANPLYSVSNSSEPILESFSEPFRAIRIDELKRQLKENGFKKINVICLDDYYAKWYVNLLITLLQKMQPITTHFGKDTFRITYSRFAVMLQAILDKKLGGAAIYASK